jgi:acetyl-CoA carboxylase carboxyl transferase subunit beta
VDVAPWLRCTSCSTLLYRKRLRRNLDVCPECGNHRRLDALERIRQLVDPDTFTQLPDESAEVDPVGFVDSVPYPQRLAAARADTGLAEAVLCGEASIGGHEVVLAVMDFRFLGGSLGSAVGELITCAAERALARRLPLVLVTASGGARMQEGVLSLMQMAAVSQAIAALREAGLLTISLITDPTFGGVAASFATNTDVLIAESGARMGFAGPRVIRQTIRQPLPEGFQTAEFLLRHGQVDMVVERQSLRTRLQPLLAAAHRAGRRRPALPPDAATAAPVLISDPDRLPQTDAWRGVQSARNTDRPTTLDYLATTFDDFIELHGDRVGADCPAIVAGLARLGDEYLVVVGHQKGHDTKDLLARNFGMPTPAGYRKAQRVMRLAAQLGLPVVTLVDTPGAYPGVEAEEQGQAAAIADSILAMTGLRSPVVAVVTGEGGSGGALALAVADRVLMLERAVYSVISPEGCAAILWNDPTATPRAARALRITAPDLLRLGVADAVVPEPRQGAHADPLAAADLLRRALVEALAPLLGVPAETLVRQRRRRFRQYGAAVRPAPVAARPR